MTYCLCNTNVRCVETHYFNGRLHFAFFTYQAELVALRHDLVEDRAAKQVLEKEVNNLLLQLHAVQLQLHSNTGMPVDSENIKNKLVSKTFV